MNDAAKVRALIEAKYPNMVEIGDSGGYVSYAARRADGSQIVGIIMLAEPVTDEEAAQIIAEKLRLDDALRHHRARNPAS